MSRNCRKCGHSIRRVVLGTLDGENVYAWAIDDPFASVIFTCSEGGHHAPEVIFG